MKRRESISAPMELTLFAGQMKTESDTKYMQKT